MKKNRSFKVGDKIVKFGQIYRIFKVSTRKGEDGKKEKVIHFRAYFKNSRNKNMICSIPVKNIALASIRRPVSKKELKDLLKEFSKPIEIKTPINTTNIREMLNLNDPFKTAQNLKKIWMDKQNDSTSFTKSKSDIYKLSIDRLVEEIALVRNTSVSEARKIIRNALIKKKMNNEIVVEAL